MWNRFKVISVYVRISVFQPRPFSAALIIIAPDLQLHKFNFEHTKDNAMKSSSFYDSALNKKVSNLKLMDS